MFNENTNEYDVDMTFVPEYFKNPTQVYNSKAGSYVAKYKYTTYRDFTSFRDFLNWVAYTTDDKVEGINALLKKINIATEWYTDRWGLHAFELREEVRYRQEHINEWLNSGEVKIYDLNEN